MFFFKYIVGEVHEYGMDVMHSQLSDGRITCSIVQTLTKLIKFTFQNTQV